MTIKAECAWGMGPDVLVSAEGPKITGRLSGQVWLDLTAAEARRLAAELLVAAEHAEELDKGFDEEMRKGPTWLFADDKLEEKEPTPPT